MNPFVYVFTVLGIAFALSHLTGQIIPEITGFVSILLFLKEYLSYREVKEAEPDYLPGITERIYFFFHYGHVRALMLLAEFLGVFTILYMLWVTYGILK